MSTASTAFDPLAERYDRDFVCTRIGARMRGAVWVRCAARFAPGARILEMNCGTGEDARWLAARGINVLATDASPAMLAVAREKAANAHAQAPIRFAQLEWERLDTLEESGFDGLLSNFGGLNCVTDLDAAARALAKKLRPGGIALLCIMGPTVPWEWLWYLAHGQPSKAFRRLHRQTLWSGIPIRYPSIGAVRRSFAPQFSLLRAGAIGALLPPPYTEAGFSQYPRLLASLDWLERHMESQWPLPQLADHYLLELVRA